MNKKNLAKAMLFSMVLTAGATSTSVAASTNSFETSTLLAVAACGGGSRTPPPGYNDNYSQDYSSSNQNDYNTADDSSNPYATPARDARSGAYNSSHMNQGGGSANNNWNTTNRAVSGGGSQTNPYGTDQRMQNRDPAYRASTQGMNSNDYNSQRYSSETSAFDSNR